MKLTLIILASTAVVLGIIAFFVVFYSGGTYAVVSNVNGTSSSPSASSTLLVLPSASSTPTSTASSTYGNTSGTSGPFATNYSIPPITWTEGGEEMGVTGASFDGVNQLTLRLEIAMGSSTECVPVNLRMLTDEQGDLATPETTQFTFPETGSCQGAPGATYNNVPVIFTVDPNKFPLFLTTGGISNLFFNVATTSYGGVNIVVPSHAG